jgi:hypothetical protein
MQCFLCKRSVQADDKGVHDATLWHTSGNFGSRVYDQLTEGAFLEIAICDGCLTERQQLVEEVTIVRRIEEVSRHPAELG